MSSNRWKTCKLEDVCIKITSGGTPATRITEYYGGSIPWLKTQEIDFNRIYDTKTKITENGLNNSSVKWIPENSIIVAMYGATAGKVAINKIPLTTNQACCNLIVNHSIADYNFIYYIINARFPEIAAMAVGGAQQNLNAGMIRDLDINLPDLPTQQRIASILSALDDKIDIIHQTNQTLEVIAHTLFIEWFVNFNFPRATGEMQDSELGPIPKEWKVGTLSEVANIIDCLHSKKPGRVKSETGFILLQLWNILDSGLLDLSDIYWITQEDYKKWISRIEATGGVSVITNVGRVGVSSRIPNGVKAALGRNMTAVKVKDEFPFDIFMILLLSSDWMKNEIDLKTDAGTILDSLNVRNIPLLRFILPSRDILEIFEEIIKPIWEKMEQNIHQSQTLTQIRNSLLPKLMNGEIEV